MNEDLSEIWEFGDFQLDVRGKILRKGARTVTMPLKEIEVLSILVRNRGELVTKDELLNEIWEDSFVEESNLSRHIYLLRKTLKELGADDHLIENVPRRGYRFTGEVRQFEADEVVIETRTHTQTLIEFQEEALNKANTAAIRSRIFGFSAAMIALVTALGFAAYQLVRPAMPIREIRSLAVLQFRSVGADPEFTHSGAGLADILTTRLSGIKDLRIGPVTVGVDGLDAVAVGQKLGVDAVLEGAIYHTNDRVRVTARLVRVGDASIIWSGEFEKLRKDELLIHKDIAVQMIPVIALNLNTDERDTMLKRYTDNADAYELYLKGRYEWNKRSTPGMVEAQRLFRNAIEADPDFALAYVGLADVLLTHQPSQDEAWVVITKALELDPNLAEAHASRGFHLMFLQWRWQDAEAAFKRSIDLNPNYATARHWYATLLAIKGEKDAAKSELQKGLELNPLSYNFLADLGQLHYFSGDYAEAEKYCLKALEIYPEFAFAHEYLHYIYLRTGQYEKAVTEMAEADEINTAFAHNGVKGNDKVRKHREVFQQSGIIGYLEYRFPGTTAAPENFYNYAMKYALVGDSEKALDYLERSTEARMFLSAFIKAEPIFEQFHDEERYREVLRKMGLT